MIPRLSVRDGARGGAVGACLLLLAAAPVSGFEIEQRNALRGVSAYDVDALVTFAAQVAFTRDGAITAAGLADSVEQIYREDGYLLAEARVAADGDTVIVDEGMIDRLEIEGVDARTFRTLEAIFRPVVGVRPLTQSRFERAVMLAEDMPDLDVAVEIDYPDDGGARLRVLATRFRKQAGSVTFDNPPRLLGEAASLYVEQEFYSLLSPGDFLRFELAGTREWDAEDADSLWGAVAYRTPLTANGLYGEVYLGSVAARRDVRGDFARTELEGETASVAIGFPLQRDIHRYGYALLDYRLASTESESGGTRLASEAAVLGLSYIYGHAFDSGAAMEAAVTLSLG